MSDSDLNLAVAKIMWPNQEWYSSAVVNAVYSITDKKDDYKSFDYATKEGGFDMARWLSSKYDKNNEPTVSSLQFRIMSYMNYPNRELAKAIKNNEN